jgi:hypothetical protein
MRAHPTVEKMQSLLRARVCADCPYRNGEIPSCDIPRACEAECPLFVHLPVIREGARQVDPMVGKPRHMIHDLMRRLGHGKSSRAKIARQHTRRVTTLLAELFGY